MVAPPSGLSLPALPVSPGSPPQQLCAHRVAAQRLPCWPFKNVHNGCGINKKGGLAPVLRPPPGALLSCSSVPACSTTACTAWSHCPVQLVWPRPLAYQVRPPCLPGGAMWPKSPAHSTGPRARQEHSQADPPAARRSCSCFVSSSGGGSAAAGWTWTA